MRFDYKKNFTEGVLILFFLKFGIVCLYKDEIGVWEDEVIARNMVETEEMIFLQSGTSIIEKTKK